MSDFIRKNRFLSLIVAAVAVLGTYMAIIVAQNWGDPGKKAFNRYRGTIAGYSAEVQQSIYYNGRESRYVILDNAVGEKYSRIQGHFVRDADGESHWSSVMLWRPEFNEFAVVWGAGSMYERTAQPWPDGRTPTKEEVREVLQLMENTVTFVMTTDHLERPELRNVDPVNPNPDSPDKAPRLPGSI